MMSSVLLLLMWSCSSDNDAPENGEEVPILLSSSFSSATRAVHEDEIDPEATNRLLNFWVYGYKTVAGNDIQMMNQQLVSRDAAGFPWTYSPLKYWDRAASNYLFVGYVPSKWQEKYGLTTPLNRREVCYYNVQIGSKSELEILAELVE